ncbi:MAG: serine/threonine-protein kinase [Bryobacteraceae bacterium]|jgi:serine/threonine-protein kinase
METARWRRIQALFHDAADLPGSEQASFLRESCGDDESLIGDVAAMLQADVQGGSLLDSDMAEVAEKLIGHAAPLPFKKVGPWRIRRLLGEGGMAVVYLGERDDLGNMVAIKILRDALLSPARRDRFAMEQRTLAQLNHPSIARLYDGGALPDGTPWFVMEYVEGLPLTAHCVRSEASVGERLRLFREVCAAVHYVHLHAVIHRDLKPSNILVTPDGSVRLLDFGIAKQLDGFDAPVDQTRTGLRLMTPAYAAPEQLRGDGAGIYTDIYALGVVLYELLAGKLPFDLSDRSPGEVETIVLEHEPEKPSGVADLDVMCLTAMHKDPARRYASVDALIRDIDHYLKNEPLEAQPDRLGYHARKFVRRNRRAVTVAALIITAVAAMAVFFTARLAIARNAARAEAARAQRIQQFMLRLFQGGDEAVGPGENLRVITLLDRGVQEAEALNSEPTVQADLYQTLGGLYQKLGRFERADSLLRSGLNERRSVFGADSAEVADSLVALGLLRIDQAQLPEAERLVRKGLEMSKRHLPAGDAAVARNTTALGRVLEERGAYDQAAAVLEQAVRLDSARGPVSAELAASLNELASTHFYAGRYTLADPLFRRVLDMNRKLYGERHPLAADALINVGAVQYDLGYYAQAENLDRQALAIDLAYYGKDHPETAHAWTVLGRALQMQRRSDEAVEVLKKALSIEEQVYGPVSRQVASVLNELGSVAYSRKYLDEAEARFGRMADIYRAVYNGHHYLIGIALSNLAGVYLERKQYRRAEQLYREALQVFAVTLPADHLNAGITRIKLGRTLFRAGRYREAQGQLLSGYAILKKQVNPSVSWLQNARKDLAGLYDALSQPEKANRFRAEAEQAASKVNLAATK